MNQTVKNIGIDLITPACLLLLALFLQPYLPAEDTLQSSQLIYLPFALLTISLLLGWKFNELDSMSVNLILIIAYTAIIQTNSAEMRIVDDYILALSVLLPINILFFRLSPISSLISYSGISRFLLIAIQTLIVYTATHVQYVPFFDLLSFTLLPSFSFFNDAITQVSLLLFFITSLFLFGLICFRQKPLDSTLLGVVIAIFVASINANENLVFLVAFSLSAIMLSLTTIQASYNMAFIDTLTGLPSRRAMELEINKLGKRYTLAMLDIDHFKKLNDKYGHDVGDQVLRMVSKHIRRVGGGGRPARYGGEEFTIIFPNRTVVDSAPFLEVVRGNIAKESFALRHKNRPKKTPATRSSKTKSSNEIFVTISIGVAESSRTQKTAAEVMKSADDALYKAKKQGRNRLC